MTIDKRLKDYYTRGNTMSSSVEADRELNRAERAREAQKLFLQAEEICNRATLAGSEPYLGEEELQLRLLRQGVTRYAGSRVPVEETFYSLILRIGSEISVLYVLDLDRTIGKNGDPVSTINELELVAEKLNLISEALPR